MADEELRCNRLLLLLLFPIPIIRRRRFVEERDYL